VKVDKITKRWIRNASDELAVRNGCWFDERRGQFVVDFCQNYLRLYEGEFAGQPVEFRDWQFEATMRLFSWVRKSKDNRWAGDVVRRFNRASIWVPKKNKKSPTLAAWSIYLACGEGEQGQKVFFGAKDGKQAREIAGKHAIEMVLSSPDLMEVCEINKTTSQITHLPSRSTVGPMASGDSGSQKAQEGKNGIILIDEANVVDRAFVDRVSRAGISRKEPLQIDVSTAGDDPESYGKEQFDYGALVEKGQVEDERFFYLAYAAPQDLTDAELAKDPVKYGKMANPAWGHTVGEEEYLDDYRRSSKSRADLALFKMYRLNIWQASSNPWLNASDWQRNKGGYTEDDLAGRVCYAGLDLSKSRDTTALVLIFPEDDGSFLQVPYFWLPRDRADDLKSKVRYLDWADQGHVTLQEGDEIDYQLVRAEINRIRDKFELIHLVYDDRYAALLMQRLREEDGMGLDSMSKFSQGIGSMAGPTSEYEKLLKNDRLKHPDNSVFNWQAGHVHIQQYTQGEYRPVKPSKNKDDYRTIDGIVAAVMGLAAARAVKPSISRYYEDHEVEVG
jgi:phage terminase large subunit-like protein